MSVFFTVPSFVPSLGRPLNQKKHCPIFSHLGFGTLGHGTKVVRFWVHRRADLTACKDKRNTYVLNHSRSFGDRARSGPEVSLSDYSGRALRLDDCELKILIHV